MIQSKKYPGLFVHFSEISPGGYPRYHVILPDGKASMFSCSKEKPHDEEIVLYNAESLWHKKQYDPVTREEVEEFHRKCGVFPEK